MIEEWKDIKGYEGLYQVSNLGKVKSLKKEYICGNGTKKIHGDIILRTGANTRGYLSVILYKNGEKKQYRVNRLVLQTFVGYSDLESNHKNGIKTDNRLENLEYCTRSENILHAYKIGLVARMEGEKNPASKLTNEIIKNIRENKYNLTKREFAECYDVHVTTIYRIVNKEKWLNV
jgi:hypothetical protein